MADPVSHDPQSLFSPGDVPSVVGTVFTSPTGAGTRGTRIASIWICNHTAGVVTYTLHHVNSGGVALPANKIYDAFALPPGETFKLLEGIILDPGDFLAHLASAGASISVHGFGWNQTD